MAAVSVKTRDDVNDKYGGVGLLVHVPCGAIIGEDSPRRSKTEREWRRGTPDNNTKHKLERMKFQNVHAESRRESPNMLKRSARHPLPLQKTCLVLTTAHFPPSGPTNTFKLLGQESRLSLFYPPFDTAKAQYDAAMRKATPSPCSYVSNLPFLFIFLFVVLIILPRLPTLLPTFALFLFFYFFFSFSIFFFFHYEHVHYLLHLSLFLLLITPSPTQSPKERGREEKKASPLSKLLKCPGRCSRGCARSY